MRVSLAKEKKTSITTHPYIKTTFCSIRNLSQLIGSLVAFFPAAPCGPAFYRHTEMSKTQSLKLNAFNFARHNNIMISLCKVEINWLLNESTHSSKSLTLTNRNIFPASKAGWGAYLSISEYTQGFWSPQEQLLHINVLELKAV